MYQNDLQMCFLVSKQTNQLSGIQVDSRYQLVKRVFLIPDLVCFSAYFFENVYIFFVYVCIFFCLRRYFFLWTLTFFYTFFCIRIHFFNVIFVYGKGFELLLSIFVRKFEKKMIKCVKLFLRRVLQLLFFKCILFFQVCGQ